MVTLEHHLMIYFIMYDNIIQLAGRQWVHHRRDHEQQRNRYDNCAVRGLFHKWGAPWGNVTKPLNGVTAYAASVSTGQQIRRGARNSFRVGVRVATEQKVGFRPLLSTFSPVGSVCVLPRRAQPPHRRHIHLYPLHSDRGAPVPRQGKAGVCGGK